MTEELQLLWSVRAMDERLSAVRAALARFPVQRAELEARVRAERVHLDQAKTRLAELQKTRRDRERDIEDAHEQQRKFEGQLFAVKKNDEYTALVHQIDAMKATRSDLETQVLVQLEEEEKIQHERPGIEQALAKAEKEAAERRAEIDRQEAVEREHMRVLETERAGHLERLTASTRTRYERVHGSRDGRAVVPIVKGACGGCFRAQPPQVLQEAKRGDRLLSCDGCGRLIIWPPEAS